tara:strand:+ start:756 stop:950 length:195 start_codon:yes stop_codon:yes gene_type:complete
MELLFIFLLLFKTIQTPIDSYFDPSKLETLKCMNMKIINNRGIKIKSRLPTVSLKMKTGFGRKI